MWVVARAGVAKGGEGVRPLGRCGALVGRSVGVGGGVARAMSRAPGARFGAEGTMRVAVSWHVQLLATRISESGIRVELTGICPDHATRIAESGRIGIRVGL